MDHDLDIADPDFESQVASAAGDPAALLKLAQYAGRRSDFGRAAELAQQAQALRPDDPETLFGAADIIARTIPDFHLPMMRDAPRNAAFEGAIQRHVKPGMRVLDVGAGSGLLAMMAARAGATDIWSCEAQAPIADAARDIVALNGYADCITILNKHSSAIDPATDMGGHADVVVAEIIASDVVGEHALPSMHDVVRRLATGGARLIPQAAEVRVALAWWDGLDRQYVDMVAGFDLTPFNRLIRPAFHVDVDSRALALSGPAQTLFAFDFGVDDHGPDRKTISLPSDGRPANGIVQWLYLRLDEAGSYENRPGAGSGSSWDCTFYPLAQPVAPNAGSAIDITATWRDDQLRLWADEDRRAARG